MTVLSAWFSCEIKRSRRHSWYLSRITSSSVYVHRPSIEVWRQNTRRPFRTKQAHSLRRWTPYLSAAHQSAYCSHGCEPTVPCRYLHIAVLELNQRTFLSNCWVKMPLQGGRYSLRETRCTYRAERPVCGVIRRNGSIVSSTMYHAAWCLWRPWNLCMCVSLSSLHRPQTNTGHRHVPLLRAGQCECVCACMCVVVDFRGIKHAATTTDAYSQAPARH